MAQKVLENLIRDLQKTVTNLCDKVNNLECKINEQNTLIESQSIVISQLKCYPQLTNIMESELPEASEEPEKALQRPMRQARLKNMRTESAPAKRNIAARETTKQVVSESAVGGATKATIPQDALTNQHDLIIPSSDIPDSDHKSEESNPPSRNNWQVVNRLRTRKRQIVRGSGSVDGDLQTVERVKKIHACFFKPDTTEEVLKRYMKKRNPHEEYGVEKMKLKHNYYASFIITVPKSKFEYFMRPDNWPPSTEVSEWFRRSAGRAVRPLKDHNARGHTDTSA